MLDGHEPVDPNEMVYRRVAVKTGYYKLGRLPPISQKAFNPIDGNDDDGISLFRAKYGGPEDVAAGGRAGTDYFVIEMRAGDLFGVGMILEADPRPGIPGHAQVPSVNCATRDSKEVQEIMDRARHVAFQAHGPFPGKRPRE